VIGQNAVALSRHFPISRELRLLDKLLCRQWCELPLALKKGPIRQKLSRLVAKLVGLPFSVRVAALVHPAATDWHYSFIAEAKRTLLEERDVKAEAMLRGLEAIWSSLTSDQSSDSCFAIGTPFRIKSTGWAQRCLLEQPRDLTYDKTFQAVSQNDSEFIHDLVRASNLIEVTWPAAWEEIRRTVRYVVPFRSQGRDSFTRGRTLGAVYLSWRRGDPLWLAEMLVHEARHNRLNLLQRRTRLYRNDDELRYWSPWRQTNRPFMGILHGVYAFTGVARFHGLLIVKGHPITPLGIRRIMEESDRVVSMLRLLNRHGQWTTSGQKALEELREEAVELLDCRDHLIQHICPGYTSRSSREAALAAVT